MKKAFGKNTLGGGKKMNVNMHEYGRSTFNLNKVVRTTMNVGTLIPLYTNIGLNGDTWNIDLNALIKTKPAIAPLFGTYKYQVDVFTADMRLYISALHNNSLGVGMNMEKVKMPQIAIVPKTDEGIKFDTSSLLTYLGKRGVAPSKTGDTEYSNAIPLLTYYDIFKNYYANKQEEIAYVIGKEPNTIIYTYGTKVTYTNSANTSIDLILADKKIPQGYSLPSTFNTDVPVELFIQQKSLANQQEVSAYGALPIKLNTIPLRIKTELASYEPDTNVKHIHGYVTKQISGIYYYYKFEGVGGSETAQLFTLYGTKVETKNQGIQLNDFDLKNIDDMREKILGTPFYTQFNLVGKDLDLPYSACLLQEQSTGEVGAEYKQSGICVKTFQSDIFQNWLNTEWVDGVNGISEITKVDTSNGLNLDALNLAQKVYNMLNRIVVSGAGWKDWQDAIYGTSAVALPEMPVYHGGMSCRIGFEEVTSNASAADAEGDNQPLGTLAGKGQQYGKKGGRVTIHVKEPCIIMVIASITPYIDYSQGNKWWTEELKTINDLHKPALDGIGFQNLMQSQIVATAKKGIAIGKSPAWIHYMTDVNECYGEFAIGGTERYMVLQKEYEVEKLGNITNTTTYIDPTQFNYTFADTSLSAQNFWVQQAFDIKCRRIMSAKLIPNL